MNMVGTSGPFISFFGTHCPREESTSVRIITNTADNRSISNNIMGAQKDHSEDKEVVKVVISTLRGSTDGRSLKIKELRKSVLLQLNCASDDKDAKKRFKKAVQGLEISKRITLSEDGICKLKKSEIKKEKKSKKRKKDTEAVSESLVESPDAPPSKKATVGDVKEDDGHDQQNDSEEREAPINKNIPCKGNPTGVTRLFVGNLPFSVDEASLKVFLLDSEGRGEITHIKWITDKETGRFYGSAFIEVATSKDGAVAMAKNGESLMGRDIKLNYAPAREGDIWPPRNNVVTGGQAQSKGIKSMSEKPDGCCKLFIGNLSYDIDDGATHKFFGTVDAEVKAIRWIHHKDSGDFKGVGFVEFWNTESCEKAATLNGKNLLGRPIRIDWTD